MRLVYHQAVIAFCPDLTDPKARSFPIGTLLIGQAGETRLAAAGVLVLPEVSLDRISRAVLSDVPHLLRRHVDEVLAKMGRDAPLEKVLVSLHHALRNSLHVAEIDARAELELPDEPVVEMPSSVLEVVLHRLREALDQAGVLPTGAPIAARRPFQPPNTALWSLDRSGSAQLTA